MASFPHLCEYVILQIAPNPFRDEAVNIGIALRDTEGDFVAVHVTPDFGRVRCLFPGFETAHLEGLQQTLQEALRLDAGQWRYQAEETFSQTLRVSSFRGLLAEDPAAAAHDLYRQLVQPAAGKPARLPAPANARARIVDDMKAAFEQAALLDRLAAGRSAAELHLGNDPYRFDFYYLQTAPSNGKAHVVMQAVDLARSSGRIKELCFTVQNLRRHGAAPLQARAIHATDQMESRHAEYLRESGIELIPVAALPELARRVRTELALS